MKNRVRWSLTAMASRGLPHGTGPGFPIAETPPLCSGWQLSVCAAIIALVSGVVIGCSSPRGPAASSTVTVGLPDEELCRIRPLKSAPRYITLITPDCASDRQQLGLQSSTNIAELKRMGAQP